MHELVVVVDRFDLLRLPTVPRHNTLLCLASHPVSDEVGGVGLYHDGRCAVVPAMQLALIRYVGSG